MSAQELTAWLESQEWVEDPGYRWKLTRGTTPQGEVCFGEVMLDGSVSVTLLKECKKYVTLPAWSGVGMHMLRFCREQAERKAVESFAPKPVVYSSHLGDRICEDAVVYRDSPVGGDVVVTGGVCYRLVTSDVTGRSYLGASLGEARAVRGEVLLHPHSPTSVRLT